MNNDIYSDGALLDNLIPESVLHARERVLTDVYEGSELACAEVCDCIVKAVNSFGEDRAFRIGFSTGTTLEPLFRQLARRYSEGEVSFRNVEVYSTDEYWSGGAELPQSRGSILYRELVQCTDVLPENVFTPYCPDGREKMDSFFEEFDRKSRNLDLLIMGIGEEGQIGFNESGSEVYTRTRAVILPYYSRRRQADKFFYGNLDATPKSAVTMGMSVLLSARKVILLAWGEEKAKIVHKIAEGELDPLCPASLFQNHEDVSLVVDREAGGQLTRFVAPWLVGPCEWTPRLCRKAVIWLCRKVGKPILKLSEEDYLRNSLDGLLEKCGPYDKINIDIFNDLQHTITGWPGGKPDSSDETRPVASTPFPKTVVIFSPHPDDDVISMGGTFIRLVHQGHNVHVAYQTSGNVAVHDDVVLQHLDAARKLGFEDRFDEVRRLVSAKKAGEPEPRLLLDMKAAIRRSEACGACRSFGLDERNIHFLDLPFYESGGIRKLPRSQADIDITKAFLADLKPDQIYMAGDLADPHGTHRICTETALEALRQLKNEGCQWASDCVVWLYRGAWMEWELDKVDMAVPISPSQLIEKRHAIFHHLSQKDIVPFPGDDSREFWQRAEDRTQNTAALYKALGLAEYQAMEVFKNFTYGLNHSGESVSKVR